MLKTVLPRYPRLRVLGDTHLGRVFKEGVPLDRLGEREARVRVHFVDALSSASPEDIVVQTGDLFDGFVVPPEVLLFAIRAVETAQARTNATYIFYRGNHDGSRDVTKTSSFDLFAHYFRSHEDIHVFENPQFFKSLWHEGFTIGLMPWSPFKSAAELAQELLVKAKDEEIGLVQAVFTHCDLDAFGDNTFNVMPYETLTILTKDVVNGHVHTPELRQYATTEFHMVGSMEPFSHGEDPDHEQYITLTLTELEHIRPEILINKNVRLLLQAGEEVPAEIPNCLAFTVKKVGAKKDEGPVEETELTSFSVEEILRGSFVKRIILPKVADAIMDHYASIKAN